MIGLRFGNIWLAEELAQFLMANQGTKEWKPIAIRLCSIQMTPPPFLAVNFLQPLPFILY